MARTGLASAGLPTGAVAPGSALVGARPRRGLTAPEGTVGGSRLFPYLLLAPAFAAVMFLLAYPLALVVQMALRVGDSMDFSKIHRLPLGLDNFRTVLADERTWTALGQTLVYVAGSIGPAFVIGLLVALLLSQAFPGRRWMRSLILLPWAVPGVIVSILFLWLLDTTYGVVNALLRDAGLIASDIRWLTRPENAMVGVVIPTIWKAFPFFALTLLAALQSIPESLYEAAKVDGAGALARFRHVTWPGIRGSAVLAAILQTLWVLREFDIIFAMTGGGPVGATETLSLLVYNEAFGNFRMGNASALGVLILALALVVILLSLRPLRSEYLR